MGGKRESGLSTPMIFQCEGDEWSESSKESDLGRLYAGRFTICSLYLAFHDFAFSIHSFLPKRRLLKGVSYLFISVIRENEILIPVIRDSLFFLFVNRATDPPCTTLFQGNPHVM